MRLHGSRMNLNGYGEYSWLLGEPPQFHSKPSRLKGETVDLLDHASRKKPQHYEGHQSFLREKSPPGKTI
jgi:hypothetical protein